MPYRSDRGQKDDGQKNQVRYFFVSHISVIEMIAKAAGVIFHENVFRWNPRQNNTSKQHVKTTRQNKPTEKKKAAPSRRTPKTSAKLELSPLSGRKRELCSRYCFRAMNSTFRAKNPPELD
jgi:hypothetical protein